MSQSTDKQVYTVQQISEAVKNMVKSAPYPNELRRQNDPILVMNTLKANIDPSESDEATVENFYTIGD